MLRNVKLYNPFSHKEECDKNIVFSLFGDLLDAYEKQETLLNQLGRDADGQSCLFSCPLKSFEKPECRWPKSCSEILQDNDPDRVYKLHIPAFDAIPFHAYCTKDPKGQGPAWTVIFRRSKKTFLLDLRKKNFKHGIGSLYDDHFIGLDAIFALTNYDRQELWIQLSSSTNLINIHYTEFVIDNELNNYMLLSLGNFTTDSPVTDQFSSHIGQTFSTKDNDTPYKCATLHNSGWHFQGKICYTSHFFGVPRDHNGIFWDEEEFDYAHMMIRPQTKTFGGHQLLSL